MKKIKTLLFEEIRKQYSELCNESDEYLNSLMFHTSDSLRFSLKGFMLCKEMFTAHSFKMPKELKTRHWAALAKMEYPYFLVKHRLILFSEMDVMVITLKGGIEQFLESCSDQD